MKTFLNQLLDNLGLLMQRSNIKFIVSAGYMLCDKVDLYHWKEDEEHESEEEE